MSDRENVLETENQHLRGLLLGISERFAGAGFEGLIDSQLAQVLEKVRQTEYVERELGRARERMKGLECCLVEAVWSLRNNLTNRGEVIEHAAQFIPIPERLIR